MSAAGEQRIGWWGWALLVAGFLAGEVVVIAWVHGLDPWSFPAWWWRDHPFDYANLTFTGQSLSLSARLWGHDPLHLFGWTPNVFYNPVASLTGALFVWLGGWTEGAYRGWLLLVLGLTPLAFVPWFDRGPGRLAWFAGAFLAAACTLVVYPSDVGILDANPVQILYTGQWAQRLGIALGLVALERYWRVLQRVTEDPRRAARTGLTAAVFLGAAVFTHYMSGYAACAAMGLLTLWHLLAGRTATGSWTVRILLVYPAVLVAAGLLFADFVYAFAAAAGSHHHLPTLRWEVPGGALETVRQVVVSALPILLIPLATTLLRGELAWRRWLPALVPIVVMIALWAATPESLAGWFLCVLVISWVAATLEGRPSAVTWMPPLFVFLLLLACGPDSLRPLGVDLTALVPGAGSIGWAKVAAFSRFLFFAWCGVLVVRGLARGQRPAVRLCAGALAAAGLAVPLALSGAAGAESRGAQSFFAWMNATDRPATRALLDRMRGVAARTPADGYLLIEDTLHHPGGSDLAGRHLPHGHLPYLVGQMAQRPVVGGSVTTRWLTHPFAHTSRGQLVCRDADSPAGIRAAVDRLRQLSVSDLLVHHPALVRALRLHPAALEVDRRAGMTHFALEHYRPVLTDDDGLYLPGGEVAWGIDRVELVLPPGARSLRLRQVRHPFLTCRVLGENPRACTLTAWTEGAETFPACRGAGSGPLTVEVPWVRIGIEPDPAGETRIELVSRPPLLPFLVMLGAWLVALGWRTGWLGWIRRRGGKELRDG